MGCWNREFLVFMLVAVITVVSPTLINSTEPTHVNVTPMIIGIVIANIAMVIFP
jgi:hypothetical protein